MPWRSIVLKTAAPISLYTKTCFRTLAIRYFYFFSHSMLASTASELAYIKPADSEIDKCLFWILGSDFPSQEVNPAAQKKKRIISRELLSPVCISPGAFISKPSTALYNRNTNRTNTLVLYVKPSSQTWPFPNIRRSFFVAG